MNKKVRFNSSERIKSRYLEIINKLLNKMNGQNKDDGRIDIPEEKREKKEFFDVFVYCFREKYGYHHIYQIDLGSLKGGRGKEDKQGFAKAFYRKII